MIRSESILTPEENRLCLVLQYFIEELAISLEQARLLNDQRQTLLIALP
jgi:hypothetical protein